MAETRAAALFWPFKSSWGHKLCLLVSRLLWEIRSDLYQRRVMRINLKWHTEDIQMHEHTSLHILNLNHEVETLEMPELWFKCQRNTQIKTK